MSINDESDKGFAASRGYKDDLHARAVYVAHHRGVPIPSLADIEAAIQEGPTAAALKADLSDLEKRYDEDLVRMYDLHAARYLDEAKMAYRSTDPTESEAASTTLQNAFDRTQPALFLHFKDTLERARFYHNRQVLILKKRIQETEKKEHEALLFRQRQFPTSVDDYYTKDGDTKYRVMELLIQSTDRAREKIMAKYGWAWRQVEPLLTEYRRNGTFSSTINAEWVHASINKK